MKTLLSILLLIFSLAGIVSRVGAEELQEITVAPGETLWAIANKYLKDPTRWPEIVKSNKLQTSDPTIALPGTKLKIPIALIKEEYRNALLVSHIPVVLYKRRDAADWNNVKPEMILHYEDSLRTMENSQARIKFPSKEIVQINENSFVVLRPEKIIQEIQLMRGDVRASQARVIMPNGTVVQPKSSKSDYRAKIRPDETEVVFVYSGKVDVTAKGQTVTIAEGYGAEVPKSAPPQAPKPLAEFKDFDPDDIKVNPLSSNIQVKKGVVTVSPFLPKKESGSSQKSKTLVSNDFMASYRIQLSDEEIFTKVIWENTFPMGTSIDLKKQPIPDGIYFMRVAFIDALGTMGTYSIPSQIIRDTKAPVIKNVLPKDGAHFSGEEAYCEVTGTVEGTAALYLNDELLFITPEGRFNKLLSLVAGETKIKILARDVDGNETTLTHTVTYTPK